MKKRSIALLVALSLCVGSAVGGTLAWLKASTVDVVNTFTIGNINIDLNEHEYDADTGELTEKVVKANYDYKYVPGSELKKDPYVEVKAGSEACWLFVQVTSEYNTIDDFGDVIIWSINDNDDTDNVEWALVPGESNVWYRQVNATDAAAGVTYQILTDNKVTVNSDVTKEMVTNLNTKKPTLTFKAYAVQSANLKDSNSSDVTTAEAAWALAKN